MFLVLLDGAIHTDLGSRGLMSLLYSIVYDKFQAPVFRWEILNRYENQPSSFYVLKYIQRVSLSPLK